MQMNAKRSFIPSAADQLSSYNIVVLAEPAAAVAPLQTTTQPLSHFAAKSASFT
jgi:hypothetical protein